MGNNDKIHTQFDFLFAMAKYYQKLTIAQKLQPNQRTNNFLKGKLIFITRFFKMLRKNQL